MLHLQKFDGSLPKVNTAEKIMLKVNTPVLNLPSPISRYSKTKDQCNGNADTEDTKHDQKQNKGNDSEQNERFRNRRSLRHWPIVDDKFCTPREITMFEALCGGRVRSQGDGDLPVIVPRSKSAPVKLLYLDKKGKVDSRENRRVKKSHRAKLGGRKKIRNHLKTNECNNVLSVYENHGHLEPYCTQTQECFDINEVKDINGNSSVLKTNRVTEENCKKNAWQFEDMSHEIDVNVDVNEDVSKDICSKDIDLANVGTEDSVLEKYTYNSSASTARNTHMAKHIHSLSMSNADRGNEIVRRVDPENAFKVETESRVVKYLKRIFVHEHKKPKVRTTYRGPMIRQDCQIRGKKLTRLQMCRLFHNAIHFVRMVVRLLTAMTDLSRKKTPLSATEDRWHALNTSRQVREMAFNKTAFAKRKGFYKLPRWAKLILSKSPGNRTEAELRRLHALLRGLKSFDKFSEKIQLSMCRSFTYHSVGSGRIILRQGHVGINFYFLYTGSVFVNTNDTDVRGNNFSKTEVVLRRGDSFGELALLQDIRRTATISCREDCELLVVDKDTFSKVCPKIFESEKEEKLKFLSRLPLFSSKYWGKEALEKICFDAQIQEYKTNKVVVEDSTKDDWIYLCMGGKCQIVRRLNLGEEIEWRKLQQCALDQMGYNRSGAESEELDGRGSLADIMTIPEDDERRSFIVETGESKEELLDSMGLEYRKARKVSVGDLRQLVDLQRSFRLNSKQEAPAPNLSPTPDQGRTTLTSIMKHEDRLDYLYLKIKTLEQGDIFDLSTVLDSQKGEDIDTMNGSYMLVSSGARVMRMRRVTFFQNATSIALQYARKITKRDRFPADEVLLQCYKNQLNWQVYRQNVLKNAFDELKNKKERSRVHNSHEDRHKVEINIKINSNSRKTAKDLELLLQEEDGLNVEAQHWKQLEKLSNKAAQKSNKLKVHFQMSPRKELEIRVTPEPEMTIDVLKGYHQNLNASKHRGYLAQRRSSVATGDLRRENLHPCLARRLSQPSFNFTSIEEEDDGSLGSHSDF